MLLSIAIGWNELVWRNGDAEVVKDARHGTDGIPVERCREADACCSLAIGFDDTALYHNARSETSSSFTQLGCEIVGRTSSMIPERRRKVADRTLEDLIARGEDGLLDAPHVPHYQHVRISMTHGPSCVCTFGKMRACATVHGGCKEECTSSERWFDDLDPRQTPSFYTIPRGKEEGGT